MVFAFVVFLAATSGPVVVVVDHASADEANEIARAIAPQAIAIRLESVGEDESRRASSESQKGDEAFAAGKQAAFEMKSDRAIAKFEEALTFYNRATLVMLDYTRLAQCYVHLGAVWVVVGKDDRAMPLFRRAIALQTNAQPDARMHNPDVVRVFRRAEQESKRTPEGNLTVVGQPQGAMVLVDGKQRGRLPASLRDLPAGPHWVTVAEAGYGRFTTQVVVASNTSVRVEAFLPSSPLSKAWVAARSTPTVETLAALDELARQQHAQTVVFVETDTGRARVFRNGSVQTTTKAKVGELLAAAQQPRIAPLGVQTVEPKRVHPALAILPFGIGQFAEKRYAVGTLLLVSQLLLIATNVATAALIASDRADNGTYFHADRDRALQIVNYTAFGLIFADVIAGGIDGLVYR